MERPKPNNSLKSALESERVQDRLREIEEARAKQKIEVARQMALAIMAKEQGRLICQTEKGMLYLGPKDENPRPKVEGTYELLLGPGGQEIRIIKDGEIVWTRTEEEMEVIDPQWKGWPEEASPEEERG